MTYKINSKAKGRKIFPDKYNTEIKFRSIAYITPKGYKLKKVHEKEGIVEFEKDNEK